MLIIGWTGGICAGKTTALACLAEIVPLRILDADALGHRLLEEPEVVDAVVGLLGPGVRDASGNLDRRSIGARVFADPALLERYNALIHPRLVERIVRAVAEARCEPAGEKRAFVVDAALIYEWGIAAAFDVVVVVWAEGELVARRLLERGLDATRARARRSSQLDPAEKARRADFVIENDDDLTALRRRVVLLWNTELARMSEIHAGERAE
jgi:dephospho-CoA kinase